jgi:hypothetical protein
MPILVIGGQARNIGKTSVAAGLIAALPQYRWAAFKISQHRHGAETPWSISEECDRNGTSDSARFLQAGAQRAWLVRAVPGHLGDAMPAVREKIAVAKNAILESNRVLHFLRPDLFLMVLDASVEDCKPSAREFLDRADALLVHDGQIPQWVETKVPVFGIQKPQYVTPEIVSLVEQRLLSS